MWYNVKIKCYVGYIAYFTDLQKENDTLVFFIKKYNVRDMLEFQRNR